MKWEAQPSLSVEGQQALDKSAYALKQVEGLSVGAIRHYFAWVLRGQLIQDDLASTVKFVSREATAPQHLSNDEEDALVAAVNACGTLRERIIITLRSLVPYEANATSPVCSCENGKYESLGTRLHMRI